MKRILPLILVCTASEGAAASLPGTPAPINGTVAENVLASSPETTDPSLVGGAFDHLALGGLANFFDGGIAPVIAPEKAKSAFSDLTLLSVERSAGYNRR